MLVPVNLPGTQVAGSSVCAGYYYIWCGYRSNCQMIISMQVPILAEDVLAKVPVPVSVPVTDTF